MFDGIYWFFTDYVQTYNGAIQALCALAICIFTAILVLVTNRQAKLMRESIDLARAEFIASHRPKLRIRRIILGSSPIADKPIDILLEVTNVGETDATAFQVAIDGYVTGSGYNAPAKPIPGGEIIISPGMGVEMKAFGGQTISQEQIQEIGAGKLILRLLGIIGYRDNNGTIRKTSFARLYNPTLRRFVKVPKTDQEGDREFED